MTAPREIAITYNGLTIKDGTISGVKARIHDLHRVRVGSTDFEVSFQVLLYDAPSRAAFAAACSTLEASMSEPLQAVSITISSGADSGTLLSLDPANNEAFNVEADIEKKGDVGDSAKSRIYDVVISGEVPWTLTTPGSGEQGLRSFDWSLEFNNSRRATLTLTGEYTQQAGGNGSLQQYLDNYPLLAAAVQGITGLSFGGVSQPIREKRTPDRDDSVTAFELVYIERIQSLSHPAIIDEVLRLSRSLVESNSDPFSDVEAPQELSFIYEAFIDHNQTTDLDGLWDGTLLSRCINLVRAHSTAVRVSCIKVTPEFDYFDNVVRATADFIGTAGQEFLSLRVDTFTEVETGQILSPEWPSEDSANLPDLKPTPYYRFGSAKEITQQINTTRETLGINAAPNLLRGAGQISNRPIVQGGGGRGQAVTVRRSKNVSHRQRGIRGIGTDLIDVTDETISETIKLIERA